MMNDRVTVKAHHILVNSFTGRPRIVCEYNYILDNNIFKLFVKIFITFFSRSGGATSLAFRQIYFCAISYFFTKYYIMYYETDHFK